MSPFACVNGSVMRPNGGFVDGLAVIVAAGKIASVVQVDDLPDALPKIDLDGHWLAPGFVDVQVNGGGGVLFNDAPTVDAIRQIAAAHYQYGTTAFLPTLISDDLDKIRQAYAAVNAAIEEGVPGVVGVHIEGPFVNVDRKGIHDDQKIRPLDDVGMDVVLTDRPNVTLMTLAPERVARSQMERLAASGVLLCAGHTEGGYEEIRASFDAGVIGVTHLFNAMSQLTGREPGAVGAALGHADCWCCIIVDGAHIHPETLRLAVKAKGGLDRFVLVTDSMPTVGQADKRFTLNGEEITVLGGACRNGLGTLAGSDLDMAKAVANAASQLGLNLAEAIGMASRNPARMLGLGDRFGSLQQGLQANMVEITPDGAIHRTWIDGRLVWERPGLS